MSSEFEAFTRAAAQTTRQVAPSDATPLSRVAVLGGGADARMLAAMALWQGGHVTLFSAYGAELDQMRSASGITIKGDGALGTYKVESGPASLRLTAELDTAVKGADLIFLTGPVHKQRTYAMVLADHLEDGQRLVVPNARSFAALETAWMLRLGGYRGQAQVIEMIGLPYWYSAQGAELTLSRAPNPALAGLPQLDPNTVQSLQQLLGACAPHQSVLSSSFRDLSAAVEIPALILGGAGLGRGGPSIPMGGQALAENQTFAALIGPDQMRLIESLADERRKVGAAFGIRDLPQTEAWITEFAGAARGAGSRSLPDPSQTMGLLRDGVLASLVPLVSAAELAGIAVRQTRALITLTEGLLDADIAAQGRRLDTIGIAAGGSAEAARRNIEALALKGGD